jgi:hypothetical protein
MKKNKHRITRTPLNIGGELGCYGRVGSFCSTSGSRRVITSGMPSHFGINFNSDLFIFCPAIFVLKMYHSPLKPSPPRERNT